MMDGVGETIRIEVAGRWDALDLARRLSSMHTYLVQLGDSRWLVCVRAGEDEDLLPEVRRQTEAWAREHHVATVLRSAGVELSLPSRT